MAQVESFARRSQLKIAIEAKKVSAVLSATCSSSCWANSGSSTASASTSALSAAMLTFMSVVSCRVLSGCLNILHSRKRTIMTAMVMSIVPSVKMPSSVLL